LLKLKAAAEYCDMTPAAFEREVMAGRFPAAVTVGQREHWDRQALDRAIDNLVGSATMTDYHRKLLDKLDAA
jgi:hypothetical protein